MYHRAEVSAATRWAFLVSLVTLALVLSVGLSGSNLFAAGRYLAGSPQADQAMAFDPYAVDAMEPQAPEVPEEPQAPEDDADISIFDRIPPQFRPLHSVWVWIPARPPQASPVR